MNRKIPLPRKETSIFWKQPKRVNQMKKRYFLLVFLFLGYPISSFLGLDISPGISIKSNTLLCLECGRLAGASVTIYHEGGDEAVFIQ